MAIEKYDIVIIGGGMVGATLAIALSDYGYRVAVVEAHAYNNQQPSFDDRAIALSWGSSRFLQQLRLWPALKPFAAPINKIHVSDRGHFGLSHMHAEEEHVPALGYVVTASNLGDVLTAALPTEKPNFHLYCPARLQSLSNGSSEALMTLESEQQSISITAKLVVAADGAQSTVRRLLNIAAEEKSYRQNAIIANITPQLPHRGIAYERFTATGPIAVLPMVTHHGAARCALVWTVPEASSEALLKTSEEEFLQRLQSMFGFRLGHLKAVGGRSAYALSLVQNNQHYTERVVFIGNAAQTLHPVAGQGFNLALRDVATLLDCLLYPKIEQDPGVTEILTHYQMRRKQDQRRVIQFTDSLIYLFSNEYPIIRHARAAGLMTLDTFPVLRRQLARQAMGLNLPLPHLRHINQH